MKLTGWGPFTSSASLKLQMPPQTPPKLNGKEANRIWQQHCGFIELSGRSFADLQSSLLAEQQEIVADSAPGRMFLRSGPKKSVDEFRRSSPLTSYEDYANFLGPRRESQLPQGDYRWAYTMYAQGKAKWAPFSDRAFDRLVMNVMAALHFSAARHPGEIRIQPGDSVLYNVPPRPYLAGLVATGLRDTYGLRGIVDPETAERMEFRERISTGFQRALASGVDVVISMTSVLTKVADQLSGEEQTGPGDREEESDRPRPTLSAAARMARAKLYSTIGRRPVLPKDLWRPKAIVGWGLDTRFLSKQLAASWNRPPFEIYAATELGVMGLQAERDAGMVFNPYSAFYEFIPESELESARRDPEYKPRTALLDEVEPDKIYEVVVTGFYGSPFIRYRPGHLIRFARHATGYGHDFSFVGRSDHRIDIAGFTRLDESTIWKAIVDSGVPIREWTMRRELEGIVPELHLYAESSREVGVNEAVGRLDKALRDTDPGYSDLESMLGIRPLKLTFLTRGTFDRYFERMRQSGADLMDGRPPRMNAPDPAIELLLEVGGGSQVMVSSAA